MVTSLACAHCSQPALEEDRFCCSCGKQLTLGSTLVLSGAVTDTRSRMAQVDAELLQTLRDATLGEYDIYGELGRGGMAIVYLAHDIALDRKVAIKVLMPALLHTEGMAERFKSEAQSAARLSHVNIIPIYAVRETDRIVYFIMKFIAGKPLDQLMGEFETPMPIPMAQSLLLQVGRALGHLHREGVFHRDVKPGNILIDADGSAVVMDFGIAKRTDVTGMTLTGTTMGTPYYMSPEQCKSDPLTPAADQYSLGIVAYEMLTGDVPFRGGSPMETMSMNCYDELPPLSERRPDCPEAMVAAVHRMLEKDASLRFPSMADVLSAMEAKPLSADDPVQEDLVRRVQEGQNEFLARVQTPRSPVPATRSPSSTHRTGPATPPPQQYSGPSLAPLESVQAGQERKSVRTLVASAVGVVGLIAGIWIWQGGLTTGETGQVIIEGVPPGGVVVIDGTPRPGNTFDLPPGPHEFHVLADGFETETETIQVAAGGILRTPFTGRRTVLVVANGTVVVEGLPPGGIVSADGNPQAGSTFDLPPGTHEIRMSAAGFTTETRTIEVALGEEANVRYSGSAVVDTSTVVDDNPIVANGTVVVQGLPAGGTVFADGFRQSGTTFELGPGQREIRMSATGYDSDTQTVGVTAGQQITVRFPATPVADTRPGVLQLRILPVAYVWLDGDSLGDMNRTELSMTSGVPHILQFQRENYMTIDTTLILQPGETRQWLIRLNPRSP